MDTVAPARISQEELDLVPLDETKIEVKNLNFHYGKFHAIKNVNMRIARNKVTAFIGPSGCGKSTLLHVFNRMFELYPGQKAEGEINMDGEEYEVTEQNITLLKSSINVDDAYRVEFEKDINTGLIYRAIINKR